MISISSVVVASKDQISCDLEGETAILHLTSGIYYGLNDLGTRIWHLIQSPVLFDTILKTLLKEYQVSQALCQKDLEEFLLHLKAQNLVEVSHDTATEISESSRA